MFNLYKTHTHLHKVVCLHVLSVLQIAWNVWCEYRSASLENTSATLRGASSRRRRTQWRRNTEIISNLFCGQGELIAHSIWISRSNMQFLEILSSCCSVVAGPERQYYLQHWSWLSKLSKQWACSIAGPALLFVYPLHLQSSTSFILFFLLHFVLKNNYWYSFLSI